MKLKVTKSHPYDFFGVWPNEIDYSITSYKKRVKDEQEKNK